MLALFSHEEMGTKMEEMEENESVVNESHGVLHRVTYEHS